MNGEQWASEDAPLFATHYIYGIIHNKLRAPRTFTQAVHPQNHITMKKAIATAAAPAAIGPYSQAIEANGLIFVSGQLPIVPEKGEFAEGGVQAQTRQSLENMKAILAEAGLTMNDVVKTTVFLADMGDFGAMNEVYSTFFEAPFPARCAYAVKTLPKNALVEIECIAAR